MLKSTDEGKFDNFQIVDYGKESQKSDRSYKMNRDSNDKLTISQIKDMILNRGIISRLKMIMLSVPTNANVDDSIISSLELLRAIVQYCGEDTIEIIQQNEIFEIVVSLLKDSKLSTTSSIVIMNAFNLITTSINMRPNLSK